MKQYFFFLLVVLFTWGCKARYLRFDPHPPGLEPKPFAQNLIAANGEHVGYCAFSPDGGELYYALTTKDWFPSTIIRIQARHLTKKDTLHLQSSQYEGEPFVTFDGQTMYFMAVMPPEKGAKWQSDIYRVQRTKTGWDAPKRLDSLINSPASEWHVSLTKKNVLYFTSEREEGTSALHGDIYKAALIGDQILRPIKLPYPINTDFNDSDPLIAPDESFLIFHSDRPGGFGQHDLYISFQEGGQWTNPVNMGATINTESWEMAPSLTPDEKYLLFTRRKALVTTEPAQIFWVSTSILKTYRRRI